jgi:hypothetical protein
MLCPSAKYDPPSRNRETCGKAAGCWLHANHLSFSEHPHWQDLSTRRKKSLELDVGVQRRRGCSDDKYSSNAEVSSEAFLFLSNSLRVFPGENHGNLKPVAMVFPGMYESVGHICRLSKGSQVGTPLA